MDKMPYIIAVDFDGTLCDDKYPEIGEPNLELIERIKNMRTAGIKFILWTCRAGALLDDAIEWCKGHGLEFDAINDNIIEHRMKYPYSGRKITANEYWDDKSAIIGVARWVDDHGKMLCTHCKSEFDCDIFNLGPISRCPQCGKIIKEDY